MPPWPGGGDRSRQTPTHSWTEKACGVAGRRQTERPGGGEYAVAECGGRAGAEDTKDRGAAHVHLATSCTLLRVEPEAGPAPGTALGGRGGHQPGLVFQIPRLEAPGPRGTTQHGIGGKWGIRDPGPASLQSRGRGALRVSYGRDHGDALVPDLSPAVLLIIVLPVSRRWALPGAPARTRERPLSLSHHSSGRAVSVAKHPKRTAGKVVLPRPPAVAIVPV